VISSEEGIRVYQRQDVKQKVSLPMTVLEQPQCVKGGSENSGKRYIAPANEFQDERSGITGSNETLSGSLLAALDILNS